MCSHSIVDSGVRAGAAAAGLESMAMKPGVDEAWRGRALRPCDGWSARREDFAGADGLTGLANREMFKLLLQRALADMTRRQGRLALLHVDIDRFQSINDSVGFDAGDDVLRAAAQRLRGLLRETDAVCRIGGDEFAVILENVGTPEQAGTIADKLVRAFHAPLALSDGRQVFITISVGAALAGEDCNGCPELMRPGVLAVNISARQLRRPDFVEMVVRAAGQAGVAPASVELELTESMLVADPESAARTLGELRSHGFGIAIDDFGKGHSSLMHLKRFPATRLKIDRAFVCDIDRSRDDVAIASCIVALARALSIKVTAEGVETGAQLKILDGLRCDEYQGYLFGRPLPGGAIERVLQCRATCLRGCPLPPAADPSACSFN